MGSCSGGDDNGCSDEIEVFAGDSPWFIEYEFTVDGASLDITGLSIVLVFKASLLDPDSAAVHTVTFPVPAGTDATNGFVTVVLSSADTLDLPAGNYFLKSKTLDGATPPNIQTWGDPVPFVVSE